MKPPIRPTILVLFVGVLVLARYGVVDPKTLPKIQPGRRSTGFRERPRR